MRATVVVEADPVTDDAGRVLDAVEALAVNALLLQRADHALNHSDLLRAVRRYELLLQTTAADQRGIPWSQHNLDPPLPLVSINMTYSGSLNASLIQLINASAASVGLLVVGMAR